MAFCTTHGMDEELCRSMHESGEGKRIRVYTDKRRYGKEVTIVEGIQGDKEYIGSIARRLKEYCAAGGTVKEGKIEVQGSHLAKAKKILVEEFHFTIGQ